MRSRKTPRLASSGRSRGAGAGGRGDAAPRQADVLPTMRSGVGGGGDRTSRLDGPRRLGGLYLSEVPNVDAEIQSRPCRRSRRPTLRGTRTGCLRVRGSRGSRGSQAAKQRLKPEPKPDTASVAAVGQRLSRRLPAGAAGLLVFELYDEEGAPASDLAGAVATAMIRRIVTAPADAELPMVAVDLDADEASARVALSGTQTLALAPAPGESVNRIEVVVKIEAVDDLVHFHGPAQVELWGAF